jgi:hypothetical protein
MVKIKQYSSDINITIRAIRILRAKNTPVDFDPKKLLTVLRECNIKLSQINFSVIGKELLNCQSQFITSADVLAYVNIYFSRLYQWKEGINTVEELLNEINIDIKSLKSRTKTTHITDYDIDLIKTEYINIGVKLLKLKYDYKKTTKKFLSRSTLANRPQTKPINQSPNCQFKLDPDKTKTVEQYLNTIIDEGYFLDENPDFPCKKSDILNAIGELFSCDFSDETIELNNQQNIAIDKILPIESTPSPEPTPEPTPANKTEQASHTLSEFLLHSKKTILASKFKEVFTLEKGKSIRLIIKALEEHEPPLIAYGNRDFKAIYRAFQVTFDRNIGSYQSVKSYSYNEQADKEDFEAIQLKLKHILSEINTTET